MKTIYELEVILDDSTIYEVQSESPFAPIRTNEEIILGEGGAGSSYFVDGIGHAIWHSGDEVHHRVILDVTTSEPQ